MSRIGKRPIPVPSGVSVEKVEGGVRVKGPKGTLTDTLPEVIDLRVEGDKVHLDRPDDSKENRAFHGLARALVANMVNGVVEPFVRELEIQGVGYRATLKGRDLELLVGYSHPVLVEAPEGVTFEVPEQTRIIVSGIDKELVGQVAADVRKVRPPEPYKGKGIRYVGEYVRRKAGKAGK